MPWAGSSGAKQEGAAKQNDSYMRRKDYQHPGLDHLGRTKQREPPPSGLDHPRTSGGLTPRTG